MKNPILMVFLILLVLGLAGAVMFNASNRSGTSGNVVNNGGDSDSGSASSGDTQKITLSMKNYNYYPNTITVKVGQPVSITLDKSIGGCYRSFTIRDLGVSSYSSSPSQTIDFTPTKKGTFRFACSMGMGTGTIIVE